MGRGLIVFLMALLGFAASAKAQTAAPPSRFANWTSAIVAADWRDGADRPIQAFDNARRDQQAANDNACPCQLAKEMRPPQGTRFGSDRRPHADPLQGSTRTVENFVGLRCRAYQVLGLQRAQQIGLGRA